MVGLANASPTSQTSLFPFLYTTISVSFNKPDSFLNTEKPSATDADKPAKKTAKKKKAAAKKAASKKPAAKKASAKKAAKRAAKKRGGNDAMETDSMSSSEADEQTEQAGREHKASVEMNVVDVGDVAPSEKKKGWWSR